MTDHELLALAEAEGFLPALISPREIPVDGKFRVYCEENLCGKYGANYSCPPDCGTPEELHRQLLAERQVLVVEKIWEINGYEDKEGIRCSKRSTNAAVLRLMEKIRQAGYQGFCTGYNGCPLCDPCNRVENQPCKYPDKRISCMSAYCVDVAELASRCGLPFAWDTHKLHLFGMVAFHRSEENGCDCIE